MQILACVKTCTGVCSSNRDIEKERSCRGNEEVTLVFTVPPVELRPAENAENGCEQGS